MGESNDSGISAYLVGKEDSEGNANLESDGNSLLDFESVSSGFDCLEEAPGGDESAMGKTADDAYNMADYRVMAKYIATFDENWSARTAKERWAQFCERVSWLPAT